MHTHQTHDGCNTRDGHGFKKGHRHMMAGRGQRFEGFPGGKGGRGDRGGKGDGFSRDFRLKRMLRGTDLRLVILLLIEDAPRHGYDLIKAIEEKSAEAYSPSPGVIYPALTFLEEAGYATTEMDGTKKVYAITETGRAHLDENRAEAEAAVAMLVLIGKRAAEMRERLNERGEREDRPGRRDRDIPGVLPQVNQARRALKAAIAAAISGDEDAQKRLAEILQRAADDIGKLDIDI